MLTEFLTRRRKLTSALGRATQASRLLPRAAPCKHCPVAHTPAGSECTQRTRARMSAHLGMWRSAACVLKERPQFGHGTSDGSGAELGGGGRSRPLLPSATACAYARALRMASRSWCDLFFHAVLSVAVPSARSSSAAAAAAAAAARDDFGGGALLRAAASASFLASSGTAVALLSKTARFVWKTLAHAFCASHGGGGSEVGWGSQKRRVHSNRGVSAHAKSSRQALFQAQKGRLQVALSSAPKTLLLGHTQAIDARHASAAPSG